MNDNQKLGLRRGPRVISSTSTLHWNLFWRPNYHVLWLRTIKCGLSSDSFLHIDLCLIYLVVVYSSQGWSYFPIEDQFGHAAGWFFHMCHTENLESQRSHIRDIPLDSYTGISPEVNDHWHLGRRHQYTLEHLSKWCEFSSPTLPKRNKLQE